MIEKDIDNINTGKLYKLDDILVSFFAIMTAFFSVGSVAPPLQAITKGREAAYSIFNIIDTAPKIIDDDVTKITPSSISGDIEFKNVKFNYPSRPSIPVLSELSMKIEAGQKVAFVGETGCGKSTLIQLVERFYDPLEGNILFDGINLKDYNLVGLRKFIGYVGQEPVLFAMSIKDNLMLAKPEATDTELKEALEKANAWNFVQMLEKKIDTFVGVGGCQLSGGQKQRIAIARAILQNPSILLLDESTSALDRKNEKEIQETLDTFSKNRTTITIAHRLTTIMNSDVIFVLENGKVCEQGSHDFLMDKKGVYHNYVKKQEVKQTETEGVQNEEDDDHSHLAENQIDIEPHLSKVESVKLTKQKSSTY